MAPPLPPSKFDSAMELVRFDEKKASGEVMAECNEDVTDNALSALLIGALMSPDIEAPPSAATASAEFDFTGSTEVEEEEEDATR